MRVLNMRMTFFMISLMLIVVGLTACAASVKTLTQSSDGVMLQAAPG